MRGRIVKLVVIGVGSLGTIASLIFMVQAAHTLSQLPSTPEVAESKHGEGHAEAGHGEAAHGEGHAEAGHGEAHAEAGHGEAAHGEGGHGEAAHGEGHGEGPARSIASTRNMVPIVSLEEVFANISDQENNHTLAVKLELELFSDGDRNTIDQVQSGIRHTVLQASREQTYERLTTIAGKLYYKEFLVGRLNAYLQKPLVRDIHFSSFFLQ